MFPAAEAIEQSHAVPTAAELIQAEDNLLEYVRSIMIDAGLKQRVLEVYDNNQYIKDAQGTPANMQRFLLNRFWMLQVLSVDAPSHDVRFSLIDTGSFRDWKRLFKDVVLPFAVQHNLPRCLN
jgi:hypothetical protein